MSLSDRLAAAARARGERVDGPAVQERRTTRRPSVGDDGLRVILQASRPVTAVEPDPMAPENSVCPTCGRTGELGIVDLARRTADWSCVECGTLWRVTAAPVDGELLPPVR